MLTIVRPKTCPYSYLAQVAKLCQVLSTLRHTSKKSILCAVSEKVVKFNDQTNYFSPEGEADSCGYCPFTLWVKGRSYGVYQLKPLSLFSSRQPDCTGSIRTLRWVSHMPFLWASPGKLGPPMYIITFFFSPRGKLRDEISNSFILTEQREELCSLPTQATVSLFSLRKLDYVRPIRGPRLASSKKPVLWGVLLKKLRY